MARRLRVQRQREERKQSVAPAVQVEHKHEHRSTGLLSFYDRKVKLLTIFALIITALCLGQVVLQSITKGEFITRGVSLKGGITVTVPTKMDPDQLTRDLASRYPGKEVSARGLEQGGIQNSVMIESDITQAETDGFLASIEELTGLQKSSYSVDIIGSSLGESFFFQVMIAIIAAFLGMAIVVFIYFRKLLPSGIVVLCAFSDLICTVAVVNLLGIKVSTAGIAAFLMLIGYSVDTDILLTTRVLMRTEGTVFERIVNAAKTGLTMTVTAIAAVLVVLLLSKSEVLNQIMVILLIGLLFDILNTWITNVGLLKWYLERKNG
jgi:preprotein translocase subunit SecF